MRLILRPHKRTLDLDLVQGVRPWHLYAISVAKARALATMSRTQTVALVVAGTQTSSASALS